MRCPLCNFVFSEDFDLCPGCRGDMRDFKRNIGLHVHFPDVSYEALKLKLETKQQGDVLSERKSRAAPLVPPPTKFRAEKTSVKLTPASTTALSLSKTYDRNALQQRLNQRNFTLRQQLGFAATRSEANAALKAEPQSVSLAQKLPELSEIHWRFEEARKEARGIRREETPSVVKIEASKELLEKIEAARLNPSLLKIQEQRETPLIKPSLKETWRSTLVNGAAITLISLLWFWITKTDSPEMSPEAKFLYWGRDFVFNLFAVSWFFAFLPLLNDGKLLGGLYLVEPEGTKADFKKLFIRGLLFPPVYFFFLWIIGIFSGVGLHTTLSGLKVSTVVH